GEWWLIMCSRGFGRCIKQQHRWPAYNLKLASPQASNDFFNRHRQYRALFPAIGGRKVKGTFLENERYLRQVFAYGECRGSCSANVQRAVNFLSLDETMKRSTKLVFHEHRISCPYCRTTLIFNFPTETIVLAFRACANCGKDFVIENGKAAKKRTGRRKPGSFRQGEVFPL